MPILGGAAILTAVAGGVIGFLRYDLDVMVMAVALGLLGSAAIVARDASGAGPRGRTDPSRR